MKLRLPGPPKIIQFVLDSIVLLELDLMVRIGSRVIFLCMQHSQLKILTIVEFFLVINIPSQIQGLIKHKYSFNHRDV